ncbi:MAG: hypothetical protein MOGMAGMI_00924 [Candidatus Omnitrophica bacterium]|nr:hypothetical protein [Candidatus Omnitrophota bacterium]
MKRLMIVAAVFAVVLSSGVPARAEAGETEKSVTGFFRRLFNYPVKATQETAGTTQRTLENTGEKVLSTAGENTAAIAGGEVQKTGELAAEIVTGTLETTGQTVAETAQIPVKAAEEEATTAAVAAPAQQ